MKFIFAVTGFKVIIDCVSLYVEGFLMIGVMSMLSASGLNLTDLSPKLWYVFLALLFLMNRMIPPMTRRRIMGKRIQSQTSWFSSGSGTGGSGGPVVGWGDGELVVLVVGKHLYSRQLTSWTTFVWLHMGKWQTSHFVWSHKMHLSRKTWRGKHVSSPQLTA